MKRLLQITAVLALVVAAPATPWALMPPMEPAELKGESTDIVRGKVVSVECTGEYEENPCASKTGYVAKLAVKKNIKGKAPKVVDLRFKKYEFKEGCVGSPDTLHYPGEEALYYLRCKESSCRLTHWNGIEDLRRGDGNLPDCRGKGR